ncbi:MAG TPA: YfcE family phosphodiesterase, partial [Isosphaeraceae bacterium]|nr:YfcE family phosphodiesterase [Isosphaeraceae bacterium]
MAKLGLISDVHGDSLALELAWSHLIVQGVDAILCAGDVVGYGPYPDRVVKFLNDKRIPVIRGNHDRWALERGPGQPDEFGGGTPSRETLEYLSGLQGDHVFELGGRVGVMVHGSPRSDMEYVSRSVFPPSRLDGVLEELKADVLVVGHTHEPMWYRSSRGLVVNPGSVLSVKTRARTSRTFAVVNLSDLSATIHDVESGR